MFTIKKAAELVGVSEATLRAWERRYGVAPPERTSAGYRLYDAHTVRTLIAMKRLIDSGWAVQAAAQEAGGHGGVPQTPDGFGDSADAAALPTLDDHDALIAPARTLDSVALSSLLDVQFARATFETVVDTWLLPAMQRMGEAWAAGRISVAGEHFVSHAVTRRLAAAHDAAGENASGPRVVLGMPPGVHHDLGLLSFAAAARRAGLATRYLGADVPVRAWSHAAMPAEISCAVLAVPTLKDAGAAREVVGELTAVRPDMTVAVGGGYQDLAPERCVRLGHRIGAGATALADLLLTRSADER